MQPFAKIYSYIIKHLFLNIGANQLYRNAENYLNTVTGESFVRSPCLLLVSLWQYYRIKNSSSTFVIKRFRKVHIMPKILALKTRKRHFNIHVYWRTMTSWKYKCVPFKQYKGLPTNIRKVVPWLWDTFRSKYRSQSSRRRGRQLHSHNRAFGSLRYFEFVKLKHWQKKCYECKRTL